MAPVDFSQLVAVSTLQTLAQDPYCLTASNALNPDRLAKYRVKACGYELLYGMQQVDDAVLTALQDLADQARLLDCFQAMKQGAVINRIEGYESEERQVLHTSCRDIFSDQPHCPEPSQQAKTELEKLRVFLADIDAGRITNAAGETFTTLVQVGIGGSDLGPRALYLALQRYRLPGRKACFIANVDPDDAAEVVRDLDLSRTLFNVVSKSGATLETLTNEQWVRAHLEQAGLDPARHLIAVTGEGSPMDDPTRYAASFYMYDYIGGRYSATSLVGGVVLGFTLGYENLLEMLRGANEMDEAVAEPDIRQNPALLMALLGVWNRNFLQRESVAVLPYSQPLARFPAHLQQCDMESNGKTVTRTGAAVNYMTGPLIWGEAGTNGQHAFYQLLHQGTTVVPTEFIGYRQSQYGQDLCVQGTDSQQKLVANMLAQSLALATGLAHENPNKRFAGNRPSIILMGEQLTPYSMGALLALYEAKIVFQGFCWNINSFDQEGVQLGKVLATQLLTEMKAAEAGEASSLAPESPAHQLLAVAGMLTPKSR